jgi:hypothetical protein
MKFRQALFWDTNPNKIDTEKNAQYIIERILDLGKDSEVKWMWDFYDKNLLKKVVENSRCLMPRTKNLWMIMLKNK